MSLSNTIEMTLDESVLQGWLGRTRQITDVISLQICRKMAATVGHEPLLKNGEPLPPLWHWLFFHEVVSTDQLGEDGHSRLGGFLPPVALPRRMWAGGRLVFEAPLILGSEALRDSRITSVVRKNGRSGELCFVTVEHTIRQLGDVKIVEEHDIVYREAAKLSATAEAVAEPIHLRTSGIRAAGALCTRTSPQSLRVTPSVSALFRYSALTFNTHRIHFDRDYCRHEEHYDGLVFHGPLTATLMANLAQSIEGRALKSFDYRALGPLLDTEIFDIEADSAGSIMSIAAKKTDGQVVMQASATFQAEVSSASPGFC